MEETEFKEAREGEEEAKTQIDSLRLSAIGSLRQMPHFMSVLWYRILNRKASRSQN